MRRVGNTSTHADTISFPDDLEHSFSSGLLSTMCVIDDSSSVADTSILATSHRARTSSTTELDSSLLHVPDQDLAIIHNGQPEALLNEDTQFYDSNTDTCKEEGMFIKGHAKQQTLHGVTAPQSSHEPDQRQLSSSVCDSDGRSTSTLHSSSLDTLPVVFLPRIKERKGHRKAKRRRM